MGCPWISADGTFLRDCPDETQRLYPSIDHTLGTSDGHYMRVNVPNTPFNLSYTIPKSSSTGPNSQGGPRPMCLKFWYYIGAPPGVQQTAVDSFKIITPGYTGGRPGFNGTNASILKSFKILNQWLYGRADVILSGGDMISISAQSSSKQSSVGFDDLQLQQLPCEPAGWCDFENGTHSILIVIKCNLVKLQTCVAGLTSSHPMVSNKFFGHEILEKPILMIADPRETTPQTQRTAGISMCEKMSSPTVWLFSRAKLLDPILHPFVSDSGITSTLMSGRPQQSYLFHIPVPF